MNKTNLVAAVAENAKLTKKQAEAAVNAVIAATEEALKAGDKVQLIGFGTFEVKTRQARTGFNPKTKEPIAIPASKAVAFKAGASLKEAVK